MCKIKVFFTTFLLFNFCLCLGQQLKTNFIFKKTKIFYENYCLVNSPKKSKYLNITNKIIRDLSHEFDLDISNIRDSSDVVIYLKCVDDDLLSNSSKIFFYFKRKFEEKPIEGFIYNIPIMGNQDTLAEYKTLYKPFRICLSFITANLNISNYTDNPNPKYWVNLRFENKAGIDTSSVKKLIQLVENIFYFHQREFDFQCVEKLEQTNKNNILVEVKIESVKEKPNELSVIISYKSKDILFDGSMVLLNKSVLAKDDIFKALTLLNREIKSSVLKFY